MQCVRCFYVCKHTGVNRRKWLSVIEQPQFAPTIIPPQKNGILKGFHPFSGVQGQSSQNFSARLFRSLHDYKKGNRRNSDTISRFSNNVIVANGCLRTYNFNARLVLPMTILIFNVLQYATTMLKLIVNAKN